MLFLNSYPFIPFSSRACLFRVGVRDRVHVCSSLLVCLRVRGARARWLMLGARLFGIRRLRLLLHVCSRVQCSVFVTRLHLPPHPERSSHFVPHLRVQACVLLE